MAVDTLIKRSVIIDSQGNSVGVEQRNSQNSLDVYDPDSRRNLEQIVARLEEIRDQNVAPSFARLGATKLIGSDSNSTEYITPDGALGTWPRTAMPPILGWYGLGTTLSFGPNIASGSTIFSFRNGGSNTIGITRMLTAAAVTTAFTGAQFFGVAIFSARQWTTNDTGGASLIPLGLSCRKRSSYPPTTITDVRIPFAGVITPGTRTTDGTPAGIIGGFAGPAAAAIWDSAVLYDHGDMSHTPLIYGPNEGLVILTTAAVPAAGVMAISIGVDWFETPLWQ